MDGTHVHLDWVIIHLLASFASTTIAIIIFKIVSRDCVSTLATIWVNSVTQSRTTYSQCNTLHKRQFTSLCTLGVDVLELFPNAKSNTIVTFLLIWECTSLHNSQYIYEIMTFLFSFRFLDCRLHIFKNDNVSRHFLKLKDPYSYRKIILIKIKPWLLDLDLLMVDIALHIPVELEQGHTSIQIDIYI